MAVSCDHSTGFRVISLMFSSWEETAVSPSHLGMNEPNSIWVHWLFSCCIISYISSLILSGALWVSEKEGLLREILSVFLRAVLCCKSMKRWKSVHFKLKKMREVAESF